MKEKILNRLLFIGFIFHLSFFLIIIGQIIFIFFDSDLFVQIFLDKSNNFIFSIAYIILGLPIIFLWIYNIKFLFKNDRYSKSLIPLIILGGIYSPIYYYRVKIKKIPLRNKIHKEKESVINKAIHLEAYENEIDFENDVKNLTK